MSQSQVSFIPSVHMPKRREKAKHSADAISIKPPGWRPSWVGSLTLARMHVSMAGGAAIEEPCISWATLKYASDLEAKVCSPYSPIDIPDPANFLRLIIASTSFYAVPPSASATIPARSCSSRPWLSGSNDHVPDSNPCHGRCRMH